MKKLITSICEWVCELIISFGDWIRYSVLNTRGGYFITGIVLGFISVVLYLQVKPYFENFNSVIILEKSYQVDAVKASSNQDIEQSSSERAIPTEKPSPTSLADYIWSKESSKGVNNYSKCKSQGLFNEYGFAIPGNGTYKCFPKGEDRIAVIEWINQHIDTMSPKQLLCHYNTGVASEDCEYVKNYENN